MLQVYQSSLGHLEQHEQNIRTARRARFNGRRLIGIVWVPGLTFLRHRLPRLRKASTVAGVRFGGHEMLTMVPMLLVLPVFAMPVALVVIAMLGSWEERRSVF
jgi:hypothetical protein